MKFRYLDGLRGIAAFVVVLNHLAFIYIPYAINGGGVPHALAVLLHNTPLFLLVDGDFAVCIFFVLSGIVLSARFFRTGQEEAVIASAVKRYFRLAIPVFGSVMLAYALLKLGLMFNQPAGALTSGWWEGFWKFAPNLLDAFYQGTVGVFLTDENSYNPVLWTMKLEFLGSFLVFLTLALFGKLRHRWVPYLALILIFWQTYYLAFLLGVIICDWFYNAKTERVQKALAKGFWAPLLGVSLLLGSYPITSPAGTMFEHISLPVIGPFFPVLAHVVAAFGLIIAIMTSGLVQRLLQMRIPLFLGRISFPLYLLHFLVLGSYTSYFYVTVSAQLGPKLAAVLSIVPTLALTIIIAYLYARYVDEPAIRLSGVIYRRFFASTTEAVVPMPEVAKPKLVQGESLENPPIAGAPGVIAPAPK